MDDILVFRTRPQGFRPAVEIAACYIEFKGAFLLLNRTVGKSEGGKWGVPAGKIEPGEHPDDAVVREVFEETAINLNHHSIRSYGKLYIRKPQIDYIYHIYHVVVDKPLEVTLNNEHQAFQWVTEEQMSELPLMDGAIAAFHHFKALAHQPELPKIPFYFIRHGETDANRNPNVKHVDDDLPLNAYGIKQAETASALLSTLSIKSVCFSPVQRAVQTKEILLANTAHSLNPEALEHLSECHAQVWTKMVQLEAGTGFHVCSEVEAFLRRALSGIQTSLEKAAPTLVVAHGGIHWALCYYLSIEDHPWKIGNCQIVRFEPTLEKGWTAKRIAF